MIEPQLKGDAIGIALYILENRQLRTMIVFLCVCAFVVSADAEWESSIHGNCSPVGLVTDVTGDRILVSLQEGGVWLTGNGGDSWQQIHERITSSEAVNSITGAHGYFSATGTAADTLVLNLFCQDPYDEYFHHYTLDGGESWHQYEFWPWWPDTLDQLTLGADPIVILEDRIYVASQSGVARSDDHGASWAISEVESLMAGVTGMFFEQSRPDTLYLYGYWGPDDPNGGPEVGGVITSRDGGLTWQRLTVMEELTDTDGFIQSLTRGAGDSLYALTVWDQSYPHPPILCSPDNGNNWDWVQTSDFPETTITQLMAVPERPGRLLIGGTASGLWESSDSGQTWHRVLRGLPEVPRSLGILYRNEFSGHLYLGMTGQGLFKSTDFGDTWHDIPSPPTGSESWQYWRGLLIDEGGVMQCTSDGDVFFATGENVEFSSLPEIGIVPAQMYFAAPVSYEVDRPVVTIETKEFQGLGEHVSVIQSTNDGQTWSGSNSNDFQANTSPVWLHPFESDTGTVYIGTHEYSTWLHASADSGETWESWQVPHTLAFFQETGGELYAKRVDLPSACDIMKSSDRGLTWDPLGFPYPEYLMLSYSPVLECDDTLYVRCYDQLWAHRPDGVWQERGLMFNMMQTETTILHWDMVSGLDSTMIVAGAPNWHNLFISTDYGWSWSEQDIEMPGEYSKEVCLALAYDRWRDRLWLDTGVGLAYLDDPTSAVGEGVWVFQPANYVTLDVYPNPFNASTTVQYTVTRPGAVTVTVFDLLGRRVAELVDGVARPGEHTVSFDGAGLSSGTYFLHLATPERTLSRKLTFVK